MNQSNHHDTNCATSPKFRLDIEWIHYPDTDKWVARDPLTASYFTFSKLEHRAALLFDGRQNMGSVLAQLKATFPKGSLSEDWLALLAMKWKQAHLLMPRSEESTARRGASVLQFLRQLFLNPLAIKLPLVRLAQPPQMLSWLATILFHKVTFAAVACLGVITAFLVLNSMLRSPVSTNVDLRRIHTEGWVAVLLAYLGIKSLHELGHVLACVRFGAKCREIGILLLFFTPCLYCDTTDSWKLASRWKRAAIGVAGIYVECIIAIVSSWVWLNSYEGIVQTVAASSMVICTLGTILINGNPFFRYDGYYILSDVWGVPNLAEQSSRALQNVTVELLGGRRIRTVEYDKNPWILATFATVSAVYRYLVLFMILWVVWTVLVPIGLGFAAVLILASTTIGVSMSWKRSADGLMSEFYSPRPIRRSRLLWCATAFMSVFLFAAVVPIAGWTRSRGYLEYGDSVPIYARESAKLTHVANLRERFQPNDVLFELESLERQIEEVDLRGEINSAKNRIELLRKSAVQESAAAFEVPTQQAILSELESRYSLLRPQLDSLKQLAPFQGEFLPVATSVAPSLASPSRHHANAPVMDACRVGSWIEKGTLLGHFTDHQNPILKTLVPESDMKLLRRGSSARCIFDSHTQTTVECEIIRLAPEPIQNVPTELSADPFFVIVRNENGALTTLQPHYEVQLSPVSAIPKFHRGAVATVQFRLPPRTLFEQAYRLIRLTFRFDSN